MTQTTEKIEQLTARIAELELENAKLSGQVELLKELMSASASATRNETTLARTAMAHDVALFFKSMSPKQNGALQMVMDGLPNQAIADVYECSESTAKVHVRGVMRRMDVNRRAHIIIKARPMFETISDSAYLDATGLPKDWSQDPDAHEITKLLRKKRR